MTCAQASDVAIGCLLAGLAAPADLFRHSFTGTIETIRIDLTGTRCESTQLCRDLVDEVPSIGEAMKATPVIS
jgi:hypothetical protein